MHARFVIAGRVPGVDGSYYQRRSALGDMQEPFQAGCASPGNDENTLQDPLQDSMSSRTSDQRGPAFGAHEKRHNNHPIPIVIPSRSLVGVRLESDILTLKFVKQDYYNARIWTGN
jgi:hypothetical protein